MASCHTHAACYVLPQNTPNSQNLLLRCPPTDFSLGGYGILPYPRHLLWDILPQNTPNSQNLLLRCPPTDFTDLHRYLGCAVLPQNSQNTQNWAAWVWQGCHTLLICEHPCHLWETLLCQKFLCVPCVLWESLSSHGFHRFTQILRVRCSPTEFTEFTEFVSVGMAGMPYPPTSVNIRVICGRLFSVKGSVYSVHSVGASSPLVRLVQQRLLHPLAESTEVVCTSHHLTISPQQHHFTSNPAFCMSSQYCGYDFVTTCGSLMRSPGNTMAAGANAIAMRWSS